MTEAHGLAHFVVFRIDAERFALRSDCVDRVLERVTIEPLPWLPQTIAGVLRDGADWLPVVDPAAAFTSGTRAVARATVLVLRRGGQRYGITVDHAIGRRELHAHRLQDDDGARTVTRFEDLAGATILSDDEGLITLIDPDRLFKAEAGAAVEQRRRDWSDAGTTSIVSFRVGDAKLGLHVGQVSEVLPWQEPDPVASDRLGMLGSVTLREERVPLLDLGVLFGMAPSARDEETRILIVEIGGERHGLVVDRVSEVQRVGADQIASAPRFLKRLAGDSIDAVARADGRLLLLLRLERILEIVDRPAAESASKPAGKPAKRPSKRKPRPRS